MNENLTLRNFYMEHQLNQLRRLYGEATEDTAGLWAKEMHFLKQYRLVPAKVITNELNKMNNLLTIDCGAKDGVDVGMGVACGQGVVGVVYLVSDHYAVVMPVLNTASASVVPSAVIIILVSCVGTVRMRVSPIWRIFLAMHVLTGVTGWRRMGIRPSSLQVY